MSELSIGVSRITIDSILKPELEMRTGLEVKRVKSAFEIEGKRNNEIKAINLRDVSDREIVDLTVTSFMVVGS
jgi:hypothetical protein